MKPFTRATCGRHPLKSTVSGHDFGLQLDYENSFALTWQFWPVALRLFRLNSKTVNGLGQVR